MKATAARAQKLLKQAVDACGESTSTTCAYAMFNYGKSLNRSGDANAAIPVLETRLQRWPDNQQVDSCTWGAGIGYTNC